MVRNSRLLLGATASLFLAPAGSATAGSAAAPDVAVLCASPEPAICAALAGAIKIRAKDRTVTVVPGETPAKGLLSVRFVEEARRRDLLSGHLAWVDPQGRTGTGPSLEFSVMDGDLGQARLDDFVLQLLAVSQLPL